jgi:glycosyltransferase involved in cell wall biosynthesis
MRQASDGFAVLDHPYLMVIHIPYYQDPHGDVWLTRLWHHDLVEHLSYLKDFILCAPRLPKGTEPDLVRLDVPRGVRVRFAPLPRRATRFQAFRALPRTILAVWRAVGDARIVHSGVGGWPYPLGWITNPVAKLRRRKLVIIVESSWRHGFPGSRTWPTRLYDMVADAVARWSCRRADLALFTQEAYRDALHRRGRGPAYVTPAVWINDADVVDDTAAEISWERKTAGAVRLLFAGRIETSKGIEVLLSALRSLEARGLRLQFDIIGAGKSRPSCEEAAATFRCVRLGVQDPVPYGRPFFELVRGYHGVVVPSMTDEQPRIVFDANAQAVPVIASDTDGLRPHVEHDVTGWLVPPGDSAALAAAIERASASAPELKRMGLAALTKTRGFTHQAMHRVRSQILKSHLG